MARAHHGRARGLSLYEKRQNVKRVLARFFGVLAFYKIGGSNHHERRLYFAHSG
jgi:hypothetical protein